MSRDDLFPLTARTNSSQHLEIGGCDTTNLVQVYGTPLYVFDERTLRAQAVRVCEAIRTRWPDTLVLYATKAYFSPFLARVYGELGLGLDVTSEGELEIARRAHFAPEKIYVHGNNKTPSEIRSALNMGVAHLVIDNVDEIARIASLAEELGRAPQLLLRLSPNIDAHTHRFLTTGAADSKFGLGITNGEAARVYAEIRRYPNLRLVGLHIHLGSQIFEPEAFVRGLNIVLDLAAEWRTNSGFALRELDLGGGWGVAYTPEQQAPPAEEVAESICVGLSQGLAARGLDPHFKLVVEPGRSLVASAAVALYRVGSIKTIPNVRTYAAIDGGMGDNIRPALYGAQYTARVANEFDALPTRTYAIAGRYCEQGDVLIESVALPDLEPGDLLAVPCAGAYQLPMGSNYNMIPRPAIVAVRDGQARLLRRRETIDDMLACEVESA